MCFGTAVELFPWRTEPKSWKARQNRELPVEDRGLHIPAAPLLVAKPGGEIGNQHDTLEISRSFFCLLLRREVHSGVQGVLSVLLL